MVRSQKKKKSDLSKSYLHRSTILSSLCTEAAKYRVVSRSDLFYAHQKRTLETILSSIVFEIGTIL